MDEFYEKTLIECQDQFDFDIIRDIKIAEKIYKKKIKYE